VELFKAAVVGAGHHGGRIAHGHRVRRRPPSSSRTSSRSSSISASRSARSLRHSVACRQRRRSPMRTPTGSSGDPRSHHTGRDEYDASATSNFVVESLPSGGDQQSFFAELDAVTPRPCRPLLKHVFPSTPRWPMPLAGGEGRRLSTSSLSGASVIALIDVSRGEGRPRTRSQTAANSSRRSAIPRSAVGEVPSSGQPLLNSAVSEVLANRSTTRILELQGGGRKGRQESKVAPMGSLLSSWRTSCGSTTVPARGRAPALLLRRPLLLSSPI